MAKDLQSENNKIQFQKVAQIVENARNRAYQKVNEELILMYQEVGKFVSEAISSANYGDAVVDELALFFKENHADLKGFNRRGLYRMKQFYELYKDDEKVSTVLTQLSWSNHLKIMSSCKSQEDRHFYIHLCIKERLSHRELIRQIDSAYFERYMLSQSDAPTAIQKAKEQTQHLFLDKYVLEFLDATTPFIENDLRKYIVGNLKSFILEMGKDFTFVGEEYRVQVGKHDYYIDLLFYHREFKCLVALELKIGEFKPEYIGKMNFYLEALDREMKKDTENPSIGIILCADKDDEVVEFVLSRSLSPTMVSEYTLNLIDKKLLQKKLKEYMNLSGSD